MGENEDKDKVLDPITSLAVEVENLKAEIASLRNIAGEKDKHMAQMLNANKRLVAELSATKANSPVSPPKQNSAQAAYKSFKQSLNIEG